MHRERSRLSMMEDGNRVKFVEMLQICNDIGASCVMVQINAEIESD